jgi:hypothetical protein
LASAIRYGAAACLFGATATGGAACAGSGDGAQDLAPCSAEMHIFGLDHGDADGHAAVHVERRGPSVVVLSSRAPLAWTVTAAPGARIVKVLVDGFEPSTVSVPAGVPVENTTGHLDYRVAYAYTWPEGIDSSTIELVRASQRATGQRVTSFVGCVSGSQITLHDDLSASTDCTVAPSLHADPDSLTLCRTGATSDLFGGVPGAACGDQPLTVPLLGYDCKTEDYVVLDAEGSCQELVEICARYANENPHASVRCLYGGSAVFLREVTPGDCGLPSPPGGGCEGKQGLGHFSYDHCVAPFVADQAWDIRCTDALDRCFRARLSMPNASTECFWNEAPLYEHEIIPGDCAALP